MDTKDNFYPRFLKRNNGREISAQEMLKDKYEWVFNRNYVKRVEVIDIQTTYNDYKKLHDDMYRLAEAWGRETVCFSGETDVLDLIKMKGLRKACKNKGISGSESAFNILKISEIFLCFLSVFQIVYLFVFKGNYLLPVQIFLPILFLLLFLVILILNVQMIKKRNREILERLEKLDEDKLIDIFCDFGHKESLLKDGSIYFIENFSKMNKICRAYIIAYLCYKEYNTQLWCVFDYLFEDSKKIDVVRDGVFYESFRLIPLKYEEKEKLYKEYNLQRDIDKEYLNCIGADILWGAASIYVNGGFKFHSLDYIERKINEVREKYDSDGGLTKVFYCLVYMCSKYKYSFSLNQIISLIQNEEKVNNDLYSIVCDAGERIFNGREKSREEIRSYFGKLTDTLEEYYFTEYITENGRRVKKYKFSYDILECFQKKMSACYPDEETVKRWVLVKLIANIDVFQLDRYFFDCSNLLIMSDYLENDEFFILSSYLLEMMNAHNCWSYYNPVLKRLCLAGESSGKEFLQKEAVKRAAVNNMFYVSNDESIDYGIHLIADLEKCDLRLEDFTFDSPFPWKNEMEKCSAALAGYFKLLYKTFGFSVTVAFRFGKMYRDITIEPFDGQEYLPNIIADLLNFSTFCLMGLDPHLIFEKYSDSVTEQLKEIRTCAEAEAFALMIEELLSWISSELEGVKDRKEKNVNAGMLIETSNSNMLYFIYGLLNMAFIKDREMVYENRNTYLDFISQSVFYFKIVAQGKGITRYVNDLIQGSQTDSTKLNLAINLIVRNNPCKNTLRKFITENIDKTEMLLLSRMEDQNTEEEMEEYIGSLLLYNDNINCDEFAEIIFNRIFEYVSGKNEFESGRIAKYLKIVLREEFPDEEYIDIVDEINQIESPVFAVWVLYRYCSAKKEMVERIPLIKPEILMERGNNVGTILMADYLQGHSYYDCSREILDLYLEKMRCTRFPNENDIRKYLYILDHYAEDDRRVKENEMGTYNYMVSLLLFYLTVAMAEQKGGVNLLRKTIEFMISILKGLRMCGMDFIAGDMVLHSLVNADGGMSRTRRADEILTEKFLYLEPVVYVEGKTYLSEDYFNMVIYMHSFPDACAPLIERADSRGVEIIRQKHMLNLVNLLLENIQNKPIGFHRESLYRVRSILKERYDIGY